MFAQTHRNLARTLLALISAGIAMPLAAADTSKDFADSVGAAWAKAVKAADLDGVSRLYASDAVAWFPDEAEHVGAAAIRAAYKNIFDTYTIVDAALSDDHHIGDAHHRSNWGHFSMTLKQKSDGKEVRLSGRYTDVQEKRDGRWVYIADHASAEPAAPAK